MYISRRRRRHAMGLAAILGLGLIALAPLARRRPRRRSERRRASRSRGSTATPPWTRRTSSVAHNPAADQYLIVWQSGPETGEREIHARLVDAAGTPLGAEFAVSDMGPPLGAGFEAETPAVAYNSRRNEYLVVWRGDDDAGPLVDGEFEIFAQRLTAGGDEVGANDRRISDMGPNGDTAYSAEDPASPTTRPAISTWWPGRATTTPARSWTARTRSSSSASTRTAPRSGPTTGACPTWGRTATSTSRPTTRPSRTTRRATSTWWPGRATTTPGRSSRARTRSTSSASAPRASRRGSTTAGSPTWDPSATAISRPTFPSLAYNPVSDEYLAAWEADDETGPLVESEFEIYAQRLASKRRPGRRRRPADLPDEPRRRHRLRRHRAPAWRSARARTSTWWPGPARTTPGRWSATRTRSTPNASAPMGPRSGATTCASRRWAWTATIAATASPPRSPTAHRPTST